MTPQQQSAKSTPQVTGEPVNRLKANSVGLAGVVFMAVATAAPITAMIGNLPINAQSGHGIGAPAAYIFATLVLTIFSVGYVAMAKHITAAGKSDLVKTAADGALFFGGHNTRALHEGQATRAL